MLKWQNNLYGIFICGREATRRQWYNTHTHKLHCHRPTERHTCLRFHFRSLTSHPSRHLIPFNDRIWCYTRNVFRWFFRFISGWRFHLGFLLFFSSEVRFEFTCTSISMWFLSNGQQKMSMGSILFDVAHVIFIRCNGFHNVLVLKRSIEIKKRKRRYLWSKQSMRKHYEMGQISGEKNEATE